MSTIDTKPALDADLIDPMTLKERLHWRYATKKMDPTKSVPTDLVEEIIEAVLLAPTSSGMQPFELFVITNPEIRTRIRAAAWDQSPVTDGSHLLVFAAWDNYTAERIDAVRDAMAETRGETQNLVDYYEKIKAIYLPRDASVNHDHAARQAYIALGFAMLAAAEYQIDCTPMEGFDAAAVDEILGLGQLGLRSVVMLPLGYRQVDGDWLADKPKVRKSRDLLVTEIA